MNQVVYDNIIKIVPKERVFLAEPMSKHTTFRTGGEAAVFIQVENIEQLGRLVVYLGQIEEPYFVLGNGSNLLVSDKGYRGTVIQIGENMSDISVEGNMIIAQAGALLSRVSAAAMEHGLTGMEFASGIPGSVGGAIVMNAGAYEGEMQQIVKSVTVLDKQGNQMVLDNASMEFGYRTSVIKNRPFVVTEVKLELNAGEKEQIKNKMQDFAERRRQKQPLEFPSAGSTFKRPEGHFAGKLIMEAGLRGFHIGGAKVSDKHCGFVINEQGASASDINDVIEEVTRIVYEKFSVKLETEIIRLGDF